MKQRNVTEDCAGMGKEHTMPVIFMEEKIMLEAEYEKEREKIEGKEDDRLKEERIQTLQTIFSAGLALSGAGDDGGDYLRICSEKDSDASKCQDKRRTAGNQQTA